MDLSYHRPTENTVPQNCHLQPTPFTFNPSPFPSTYSHPPLDSQPPRLTNRHTPKSLSIQWGTRSPYSTYMEPRPHLVPLHFEEVLSRTSSSDESTSLSNNSSELSDTTRRKLSFRRVFARTRPARAVPDQEVEGRRPASMGYGEAACIVQKMLRQSVCSERRADLKATPRRDDWPHVQNQHRVFPYPPYLDPSHRHPVSPRIYATNVDHQHESILSSPSSESSGEGADSDEDGEKQDEEEDEEYEDEEWCGLGEEDTTTLESGISNEVVDVSEGSSTPSDVRKSVTFNETLDVCWFEADNEEDERSEDGEEQTCNVMPSSGEEMHGPHILSVDVHIAFDISGARPARHSTTVQPSPSSWLAHHSQKLQPSPRVPLHSTPSHPSSDSGPTMWEEDAVSSFPYLRSPAQQLYGHHAAARNSLTPGSMVGDASEEAAASATPSPTPRSSAHHSNNVPAIARFLHGRKAAPTAPGG